SISSSDRRIEDLELKVNRILQALEQDGHGPTQPVEPLVPNKPVGPRTPPNIEGSIQRIGHGTGRVEINLGSDDGLIADDELAVYQIDRSARSPNVEYLGRIQIESTSPDQAVAAVVAGDFKRIREGDYVTTRIPPVENTRRPPDAPQRK